MWWLLLFIPFMLILHYFGIVTSSVGMCAGRNWGALSWWRGKYSYLSGKLCRNFITRKYSTLHIEVETISGRIDIEVQDQNKNVLYVWPCISDLNVDLDIAETEKCIVLIVSSKYKEQFFLKCEK